ncbi:UNVERIFIED_CONTAM: hypothetical protein Sindi_1379400 [Sesamum indicum]
MVHPTDLCRTLQEEPIAYANAVGGFFEQPQRYDPYSTCTIKDEGITIILAVVPNLKLGHHLNLTLNQETRSSIQNSEFQVRHLASSVSRLESQDKLPSETVVNPKQNVIAIFLCSEKEL